MHHRIRNNYAIQAGEDSSGKAGGVTNYWIDAGIPAAEIRCSNSNLTDSWALAFGRVTRFDRGLRNLYQIERESAKE
jgi:hypothetical protein